MARLWLLGALFLTLPARGDLAAKLDQWLSPYAHPQRPGAAALVLRSGMLPLYRAVGLRDQEAGEPVTPSTNFRMASVSKQFTALAAMLLVDRGQLALDASLTDLFPDFPDYGRSIRVRHLLHHTSGLKDYEGLIPSGQTQQVSDADVLQILKNQRSGDFTPGSRYRYSNSGYVVLAQIVEHQSGVPFARFVEENLFAPLGMTESRVYERSPPPPISERAYGYTQQGSTFKRTDQSLTSATQGDGGVYTSLVDMRRWLLGFPDLLSPQSFAQLFQPGTLNSGAATSYGMGWDLTPFKGRRRYSHTGSTIGFRTAVQWLPDEGFAVAVFINRAGSSPWDLCRQVLESEFP